MLENIIKLRRIKKSDLPYFIKWWKDGELIKTTSGIYEKDKNYSRDMFKIGVFAVILNKKREVLLCHRRDCDFWNLPGGGLEEKESPWEGIVREVKEETGFEIEIKKLIGVYHKDEKKEIVFSFQCTVSGGKSIINDEADQIMFFPYAKLPKNISQKHKDRIKDALKNPRDVIFKSQNFPDYLDLRK